MTVRPTASGWSVAACACVLLPCGAVLDYPELVAVGGCAATLVVLALVWVLVRPSLTAGRAVRPVRVTQFGTLTCELTVSNTSRRISQELEVTEVVNGQKLAFVLDALPGRSRTQVHKYELPSDKRGIYRLAPPSVRILDPARLVRRGFTTEGKTTFYVHPKYESLPPFGAGASRDQDGMASTPLMNGVVFHSLRDYVAGDDSRLIHWPATARTGALMMRHNSMPDAPGYLVVLDTAPAGYDDQSFEEAVRVSASLCVAAVLGGSPLRLRITAGSRDLLLEPGESATTALDRLAGVDRTQHDVWWPTAVACHDVASVVVVTGRADRRQLASIAQSIAVGVSATVICLDSNARGGTVAAPLPVITAPSCVRFAAQWTRELGR